MKTPLLIAAIVLLLAISPEAQVKTSLRAGANMAIPSGSFGDVAETGYGATLRLNIQFSQHFEIYTTTGYLTWSGKQFYAPGISNSTTQFRAIPLLFGVKYHLYEGLYVMGDAGVHFFSASNSEGAALRFPAGYEGFSTSDTRFSAGTGAGYEFDVNRYLTLDLTSRYQFIDDNYSYYDLRLGFRFFMN